MAILFKKSSFWEVTERKYEDEDPLQKYYSDGRLVVATGWPGASVQALVLAPALSQVPRRHSGPSSLRPSRLWP